VIPGCANSDGNERAGGPVHDTGHETFCQEALRSVVNADTSMVNYFGDTLIFGPGFLEAHWGGQARPGPGKIVVLSAPAGRVTNQYFARTVLDEELSVLLHAAPLRDFFSRFETATARPATSSERDYYYRFISWEILGTPITILENSDMRLLLFSGEKGKLMWMDVFFDTPLEPVSSDLDEAMEMLEKLKEMDPEKS
jgi:hypothetical protein